MCGIAGIIASFSRDLRHIQRMNDLQKHRGPDSGGALTVSINGQTSFHASDDKLPEQMDGIVALGHRRLAIIDTSNAAIQPMQHTSTGCWITYNGEIYNYKELRQELQLLGASFVTESDTEVILNAYAMWGTQCFSRLHGMWALAIYDPREQCIILSRDRFGIKPLHYTWHEDTLVFASEIKALMSIDGISRKANISAIKSYLTHQLVNHTDDTFFEAIKAFPPAHWAKIPLQNPKNMNVTAYWEWGDVAFTADYIQATKQFQHLFDNVMEQHMRSDVAVGTCLSGGLDSSAIACWAGTKRGNESHTFHSFTAIFQDITINETPWVEAANAQAKATPHWVSPTAEDFMRDIDALIWHQDEPFTSASMYAQWCVMKEARKTGIPVLLDGQGADEILCGYKKFYIHYIRQCFTQRRWCKALREVYYYLRYGDRSVWHFSSARRYFPHFLRGDLRTIEQMQTPMFKATQPLTAPSLSFSGSVKERQKLDVMHFSVPALLRFEDRNSMAFSVESRVPFLDHRLVAWCIALPEHMKMYRGTTKRIMRDALAHLIPQTILNRRDKMGFGAPEERWLKEVILPTLQAECSNNSFALSPLINATNLLQLIEREKKMKKSRYSRLLFQLFILNRWVTHYNVSLEA